MHFACSYEKVSYVGYISDSNRDPIITKTFLYLYIIYQRAYLVKVHDFATLLSPISKLLFSNICNVFCKVQRFSFDFLPLHTYLFLAITTLQSGLLTWFLTPLMLCTLILYISGGTYSLKSTPNDRFFEKLFLAIFIYSQIFCQKSTERKSPKEYFSYFVLMSGLGQSPWSSR